MPLITASASSAIPGTTVPAATVACSSPTSNPIRAAGTCAATVVRSAFSSQPGGFSMSGGGGPSVCRPQRASAPITGASDAPVSVSSYTVEAAGGGSLRRAITPPASSSLSRVASTFVEHRGSRSWRSL